MTITRGTRKRASMRTRKREGMITRKAKGKRQMGEAHIGYEWDSTKESSSDDDDKIATVAIHASSSPPRLFNNISDVDDYYSPPHLSHGKEWEGKIQIQVSSTS
jgi:hypothetical protein